MISALGLVSIWILLTRAMRLSSQRVAWTKQLTLLFCVCVCWLFYNSNTIYRLVTADAQNLFDRFDPFQVIATIGSEFESTKKENNATRK